MFRVTLLDCAINAETPAMLIEDWTFALFFIPTAGY